MFKQALDTITELINENPKDHKAYYDRGVIKNHLEDYLGAIADYDKSIILNSNNDYAYFNRGLSKYNLQLFMESKIDFDKAIALNPKFYKAYFERAKSKNAIGDSSGAKSDLDKGNEIQQNDDRNIDDLIKDFLR